MKQLLSLCFLFLFTIPVKADPILNLSQTNGNTLNDLLRESPLESLGREVQLRRLSAMQEQLVLHERRMRGGDLGPLLSKAFSIHYSAIMTSLLDDRISEDYGRDLLSVHRQLLERACYWEKTGALTKEYQTEIVQNLYFFLQELDRTATPKAQVVTSVKTPVINGFQFWIGELIAAGSESGFLHIGDITRLQVAGSNLEHFETLYKSDAVLRDNEREHLHGRFIDFARETIRIVER